MEYASDFAVSPTRGSNSILEGKIAMVWTRRVFWIAGLYGLLALSPQYFLEQRIGVDSPPAITHPEYFYGFVGIGAAWQVAFCIIATDPMRYRLMMIPSALEKFSFVIAVAVLFALGRVPTLMCAFAATDAVLGTLFLIAFARTGTGSERPA
jgi:hypothetical protein